MHVSDFRYEPVGHVVMGNLGIVEIKKTTWQRPIII